MKVSFTGPFKDLAYTICNLGHISDDQSDMVNKCSDRYEYILFAAIVPYFLRVI